MEFSSPTGCHCRQINELKLLAIRQQLSMEELKERNMELTNALSLLLQVGEDS